MTLSKAEAGREAGPVSRIQEKSFLDLVPSWIRPNHLSVMRLLLSLCMLWVEFAGHGLGLIIILGLTAGFSDLLDGALARRRGQVTKLGAFLDPLGDKVFAVVLAVVVIREGLVSLPLVLMFLITELHTVLIPALIILKRKRRGEKLWPAPGVKPNRPGKLKTGVLASALGLVIIATWLGFVPAVWLAKAALWAALALGLVAEYQYFSSFARGEFE